MNLYNIDRDTTPFEDHVYAHVDAMTTEDLRSKAAIVIELGYRDHLIELLEAKLHSAEALAEHHETMYVEMERDAEEAN